MNAVIPPDRKHLAAMLRVHARSAVYFGGKSRRELLEYIQISEDTIEQQARMLRADTDEMRSQETEIKRLHTRTASLRDLVDEAIDAGTNGDGEAINLIRAALEGTS